MCPADGSLAGLRARSSSAVRGRAVARDQQRLPRFRLLLRGAWQSSANSLLQGLMETVGQIRCETWRFAGAFWAVCTTTAPHQATPYRDEGHATAGRCRRNGPVLDDQRRPLREARAVHHRAPHDEARGGQRHCDRAEAATAARQMRVSCSVGPRAARARQHSRSRGCPRSAPFVAKQKS
jgi:hypothetical protein